LPSFSDSSATLPEISRCQSRGGTLQPSPDLESLKVGYVVKKFPRLSETFILDEVLALQEAGVKVGIHSLLPPTDGRFHADLARVKSTVQYLPTVGTQSAFEAFLALHNLSPEAAGRPLERALSFLSHLPAEQRPSVLIQAIHLADAARKRAYDHLHAHFMTLAAQATYLAHLFTDISFSVTAHAKDVYHKGVNRAAFSEIAESSSAIVTVCEANRRHIARNLLRRPTRTEVIYNSVALEDRFLERGPRDPRVIFAVGRLVEKKGFHVLLEACAMLRAQGVDFQCVLGGDGEERDRLVDERRRLGLDEHVRLLGPLSREEVLRWMGRARVLAAPCITARDGNQDALPTVLLEALASGLPIVSTPVGGIPEIVDSEIQGLLFPQGDASAMAGALGRLLSVDDLWARMSAAGPAKAATRFSLSKNLPRLLEVLGDSRRADRALKAVP
jgi:colanic acid/amylovoran biosynthesis glycosyltransferase